MTFRMPKPGKKFSPPAGDYKMGGKNPSRFTGTDIDGQVHQISTTNHSDQEKYRRGWERIWGKR